MGKTDKTELEILKIADHLTDENCREVSRLQEKIFGPKHERWFNYLAEIYILSKCDCAILQVSSGNIGALMMRDKAFEHVIMLNH